jgi:glycosyltransferase involved in cell wall biosynthesis
MRIAQIAPLFETVPPVRYGGTERVVSWLTEALVSRGHDVTLFASGDSSTRARLVPVIPRAQRFIPNFEANTAPYARMIELVARQAQEFDILHCHIDFHPLPVFSRLSTPFVTTLHGRMDRDFVPSIYGMFPEASLVSISDSQRRPAPQLNWVGTVLHGMPPGLLRPTLENSVDNSGEYFAFLGRISPEKGIEDAIAIAERCGLRLKVAAKIGAEDRAYYDEVMAHRLASGSVEFIGEIDDSQKPDFLSGARALLFPIDWPEPFGLVMIEAMACGCPVIAYPKGSVPEVIEDGLTGFIVTDIDAAVEAAAHLGDLDRRAIRRRFEERWSADRMAQDYLAIYETLLDTPDLAPGEAMP